MSVAVAVFAPSSDTVAPLVSDWLQAYVTSRPQGSVALPLRLTSMSGLTFHLGPASGMGPNGWPGLPPSSRVVSEVNPTNTLLGSRTSSLWPRFRYSRLARPSKMSAGRVRRSLNPRFRLSRAVRPPKSPDLRAPMFTAKRCRLVTWPRCVAVMSAQSVTPRTASTIASRTCSVRSQTPVSSDCAPAGSGKAADSKSGAASHGRRRTRPVPLTWNMSLFPFLRALCWQDQRTRRAQLVLRTEYKSTTPGCHTNMAEGGCSRNSPTPGRSGGLLPPRRPPRQPTPGRPRHPRLLKPRLQRE